jgi:hypothetical protein
LAQRAFVQAALVAAQAVGGLVEAFSDLGIGRKRGAVVAGENDQGVFVDPEFAKRI